MPNGNHKAKTYSRCIKIKEIKYTTKEINYKKKTAREEENIKRTTKHPENNE